MAKDPSDRRWAQSIATKPLKPFNFENLQRRNAPKQKQVVEAGAAADSLGNRFTARQKGRMQELIFRDLDFEKDNVRRWDAHGMAATGQIFLPDGEITYEHKLRRSAPVPDNEDRTAYYGRQSRKGSEPFWGSIEKVQTRDPTQNVHVGEHSKLYGPDPGQHASAVDPPWLAVAQKTSSVRGNAKGRRDWDTPDWAEKQKRKGRGGSGGGRGGRGRGQHHRRKPPGSRTKARGKTQEKHPLTRTPVPQGARTGKRPVWPTPLGGPQVLVGLGDPFWQARPASELYQPTGPLHRKPPSRVRKDAAKAAALLKEDEEEALRNAAEENDLATLMELLWVIEPSGEPGTPEHNPGQRTTVDVDAQTWAGWTALHHAAAGGYKDIAEALLVAGADPDIRLVLNGCTPYMLACQGENGQMGVEGHQEIVALLLAAQTDVNIVDEHWRTGRQLAARRGAAPKSGIGTAEKRREGGVAMVAWLDKLDELAEEEAKAAEEAAAAKEAEEAEAAEAAAAAEAEGEEEAGEGAEDADAGAVEEVAGDADAEPLPAAEDASAGADGEAEAAAS
eukprot:COSAG06_NODE_1037_length_10997_cov_22.639016_3_plen_561_part_00